MRKLLTISIILVLFSCKAIQENRDAKALYRVLNNPELVDIIKEVNKSKVDFYLPYNPVPMSRISPKWEITQPFLDSLLLKEKGTIDSITPIWKIVQDTLHAYTPKIISH